MADRREECTWYNLHRSVSRIKQSFPSHQPGNPVMYLKNYCQLLLRFLPEIEETITTSEQGADVTCVKVFFVNLQTAERELISQSTNKRRKRAIELAFLSALRRLQDDEELLSVYIEAAFFANPHLV
eukprot:TRINITY_DN128_c0_g1_i1.p2 TRINITY_DN128_c0_g1~~TRINITY_DN128_c0_g1_i1.p2  ORF type:complete len:127 (+),score=19.57 TRINITY_DN128_c0_g1_i1:450-830(+)